MSMIIIIIMYPLQFQFTYLSYACVIVLPIAGKHEQNSSVDTECSICASLIVLAGKRFECFMCTIAANLVSLVFVHPLPHEMLLFICLFLDLCSDF